MGGGVRRGVHFFYRIYIFWGGNKRFEKSNNISGVELGAFKVVAAMKMNVFSSSWITAGLSGGKKKSSWLRSAFCRGLAFFQVCRFFFFPTSPARPPLVTVAGRSRDGPADGGRLVSKFAFGEGLAESLQSGGPS